MNTWLESAQRFLRDEDGPTAVEYSVMLALIIAVCVVAIATVGATTVVMFDDITLKMALDGEP